jgi:protein gp37
MQESGIQWTDLTWNPVSGCSKISPGCKFCYAKALFGRPYGDKCATCGHQAASHRTTDAGLRGIELPCHKLIEFGKPCKCQKFVPRVFEDIRLHPDRLMQPFKHKPAQRVFVNSMSDLFHEEIPFDYIDEVLGVTQAAAQHTYQILTKRDDRMLEYFTSSIEGMVGITRDAFVEGQAQSKYFEKTGDRSVDEWLAVHFPLKNVIIGVSVEDQQRADQRFPKIVKLGQMGWRTMISAEPLLGPVVIPADYLALGPRAWVIVGGESGRGCRWMNEAWAIALRDQCTRAGVPFFFKQWGGTDNKTVGRKLDGREWNEFPA